VGVHEGFFPEITNDFLLTGVYISNCSLLKQDLLVLGQGDARLTKCAAYLLPLHLVVVQQEEKDNYNDVEAS